MGVYQSATQPEVRVKTVSRTFSRDELDRFGQRQLLYYTRRHNKIPAKVKPEIEDTGFDIVYRFRWYEVETFN